MALEAGSLSSSKHNMAASRDLDDIRLWTRIGLLIALVSLGSTVVWSGWAPLASAVVAPGIVKVDSNRKKVQHQEGGTVHEILVRDGDRVKAGQVLVRLDKTHADASRGVLRAGSDLAQAQQARLVAERDGVPLVMPADLIARRDDPKVREAIDGQTALYQARRASLEGQLGIVDKQIVFLRNGIDGLQALQRSKEAQLQSHITELEGLQSLLENGMVERTRFRSVEREVARLRGERAEHAADIAKANASIGEKELEKFQLRKSSREQASEELGKVQGEVNDLSERINAAQYTLERTDIKAPVEGIVVDLKANTAGGVVGPGEVLMELVPANERLIVEAHVRPNDVDRLQIGQPAAVKISAFDQRTMPELNGTLQYLSADIIENPKQQTGYFLMRVEIPASELLRLEGRALQPGMTADVFVRTGERTFLSYLFQPLVQSFDAAWRER